MSLGTRLPRFSCECEFKGHAIIARKVVVMEGRGRLCADLRENRLDR